MPSKPPTSCRKPGCRGLVRDGVCSVCGPLRRAADQAHDAHRGKPAERGYDARWRHLREAFIRSHPYCVMCEREGIVTQADDIDHIVPIADGGRALDENNLQALCRAHHNEKTRRDTQRRKTSGGHVADVVIVAGPPGAGKTTFVGELRGAGDIVIDLDALVAALTLAPWYAEKTPGVHHVALDVRDFLLQRIRQPSEIPTAWVITSEADADKRAALADQLQARRVLVLEVSAGECMRRIRSDERRQDQAQRWGDVVRDWWQTYQPNATEERIGAG